MTHRSGRNGRNCDTGWGADGTEAECTKRQSLMKERHIKRHNIHPILEVMHEALVSSQK